MSNKAFTKTFNYLDWVEKTFSSWFPSEFDTPSPVQEFVDDHADFHDDLWSLVRQSIGLPGSSPFFRDHKTTGPKLIKFLDPENNPPGFNEVMRELPPDPSQGIPDSILPFVTTRWQLGDELGTLSNSVADLPRRVTQNGETFSLWEGNSNDTFLQVLGTIYHTIAYWVESFFTFVTALFSSPFPLKTLGRFWYTEIGFSGLADPTIGMLKALGYPLTSFYANTIPDDLLGNWIGLSPFLNGFCSSFHIFGFLTVGTLVSLCRLQTNGKAAWYVSTGAQFLAHFFLIYFIVFPVPYGERLLSTLSPALTFPIGLAYLLHSFLYLEETCHYLAVDPETNDLVSDVRRVYVPRQLEWEWNGKSIAKFRNIFISTFMISLCIPMTVGIQGFTLLPEPALILNNPSVFNFFKYTLGLCLGSLLFSISLAWFFENVIIFVNRFYFNFSRAERWRLKLPFGGDRMARVEPITPTSLLRFITFTLALGVSFNTLACFSIEQVESEKLGFSSPNTNQLLRSFWVRDAYPGVPTSEWENEQQERQRDWLDMYYDADDDEQVYQVFIPLVPTYFDQWRDNMFDRPFLEDNFPGYKDEFITIDRSAWREGDHIEAEKAWINQNLDVYTFNAEESADNITDDQRAKSSQALVTRAQDLLSVQNLDDLEDGGTEEKDEIELEEGSSRPNPGNPFLFGMLKSQKRRMLTRRQPPRISRFEAATEIAKREAQDFVDRPNVGGAWLMAQQSIKTHEMMQLADSPKGLTLQQQDETQRAKTRAQLLPPLDKNGRPIKEGKGNRFNRDGSFRLGAEPEDNIDYIQTTDVPDRGGVQSPVALNPGLPRKSPFEGASIPLQNSRKRWFFFNYNPVDQYQGKLKKAQDQALKLEKAKSRTIVSQKEDEDGFTIRLRDDKIDSADDSGANPIVKSYIQPFQSKTSDQEDSSSYRYERLKATETRRLLNPYFYLYDRFNDYDHVQPNTLGEMDRRDYIDMLTIVEEIKDKPVIIEHRGIDRDLAPQIIAWAVQTPLSRLMSAGLFVVKKGLNIVTLGLTNQKATATAKDKEKTRKYKDFQDRASLKSAEQDLETDDIFAQDVIATYFNADKVDATLFTRFDYQRTVTNLFHEEMAYENTFYESFYQYPATQLTVRLLADRLLKNSLSDPTISSTDAQTQSIKPGVGTLSLEHAHESLLEYHNSLREYSRSKWSSDLSLLGSAQTKSKLTQPYRHQFKGRSNNVRRLTFTNRDEVENMVNADVLEYVKPTLNQTRNTNLNENNSLDQVRGPSLHENVAYGFLDPTQASKPKPVTFAPWQALWRDALMPTEGNFLPLYVTKNRKAGKLMLMPIVNRNTFEFPKRKPANYLDLAIYYYNKGMSPLTESSKSGFMKEKLLEMDDLLPYKHCLMSVLSDSDKDKQKFLRRLRKSSPRHQENYAKVAKLCRSYITDTNTFSF